MSVPPLACDVELGVCIAAPAIAALLTGLAYLLGRRRRPEDPEPAGTGP